MELAATTPAHPTPPVNPSGANGDYSLLELIDSPVLHPMPRSGRPQVLSEEDKERLVSFVKQSFHTRRMALRDIRREAGFSHVCDTSIFNALSAWGIHAYKELFKFILSEDNIKKRLVSNIYFQLLSFQL